MRELTAEDYDRMASNAERKEQESFERSDTDGCVTQWCLSFSAREYRAKAELLRNGNKMTFKGLYEGTRRVKAKLFTNEWGTSWVLHDDERVLIAKRGKKFLPTGSKSRILKSLGLQEKFEMAPAWVKLDGSGHGFSSLTTLYLKYFRTGDPWGTDAVLAEEG